MRSVAVRFGVSLSTVQRWVAHAQGQRLDRVDWSGSRGGRGGEQATDVRIEELIVELRKVLKDNSDLGEYGAAAIQRELIARRKKLRLDRVPSQDRAAQRMKRADRRRSDRGLDRRPVFAAWIGMAESLVQLRLGFEADFAQRVEPSGDAFA